MYQLEDNTRLTGFYRATSANRDEEKIKGWGKRALVYRRFVDYVLPKMRVNEWYSLKELVNFYRIADLEESGTFCGLLLENSDYLGLQHSFAVPK